jgi:ABC-type Fe3+/spermidine/putrescine transport system ATPase subunit
VEAEVVSLSGAQARVRALGGEFAVAAPEGRELNVRQRVQLVVRPEHLHIGSANGVSFRGRVLRVSYLGAAASYELALEGGESLVAHDPAPRGAALYASGSEVTVGLETRRVYIVPE